MIERLTGVSIYKLLSLTAVTKSDGLINGTAVTAADGHHVTLLLLPTAFFTAMVVCC
jgi:hypothetical protein